MIIVFWGSKTKLETYCTPFFTIWKPWLGCFHGTGGFQHGAYCNLLAKTLQKERSEGPVGEDVFV